MRNPVFIGTPTDVTSHFLVRTILTLLAHMRKVKQ